MGYVWERFHVRCRYCGQDGSLSLWSGPQQSWGFVSAGFAGLAVNRLHPANSLMRCNACGSSVVALTIGAGLNQDMPEERQAQA
jgi:ribosomal protein L37E